MSDFYNLRLTPGQDLRRELQSQCEKQNLEAAAVVAAVGSLSRACLRFADAKAGTVLMGPFEIVSLSGTLSKHGMHLHISLSDKSGELVGGHLMEGCEIHTTCELVLLEQRQVRFRREKDPATGYLELKIEKRV